MNMKRQMNSRKAILSLFILSLVFLLLFSSGLSEFSSGVKLGYTSHKGRCYWNAEYTSIDGTFSKTLSPADDDALLYISVHTEEGSVRITAEDRNKNILYEKVTDGTDEFYVKSDGKVKITIEADKHRGGFDIRYEQSDDQ